METYSISLDELAVGALGGSLGGLGEVLVIDIDLDARDVHRGGGGDHVALVNAGKGHVIELEGARDEEKAREQLLESNDALKRE